MKNQKGISMITLIITIIVIIILAAIAFIASGDTVNSAQFSTFASEFGDYAVNYKTDPYAKLEETMGLKGAALTTAQKYYMAARGMKDDALVKGVTIPAGVEFVSELEGFTKGETKLYNAAGEDVTDTYWGEKADTDVNTNTDIACYQIADSVITSYKDNHEFYGSNLGAETHWVTEKGFVFTLPGYPREVEGEYRMYISPEVYYVTGDNYGDIITGDETVDVKAHVSDLGEGGTAPAAATSANAVGATKYVAAP